MDGPFSPRKTLGDSAGADRKSAVMVNEALAKFDYCNLARVIHGYPCG
jgi:hypothetical protein